jgi:hypothetical protein
MSMTIAELAALAAKTSDQSQDTGTVFEYELPAEGQTGMRFIEYIELGFQPQKPYQGKAKVPALETLCTFELLGPKYVREIDVDGGKKTISDAITERVTVKLSDKANFRKLFNKMGYGRPDYAHIAQFLGQDYRGYVSHSPATNDKGEKIKQYANLRDPEGAIGIGAPFVLIPVMDDNGEPTGETTKRALKVRESLRPMRIFLFDNPTKETWDSLFIDGFSDVKDEKGNVTGKRSKNWIQEKIMASTKFKGSSLEAMLHDLGGLSIDPEAHPAEQDEGQSDDEHDTAPPAGKATPPAAATKPKASTPAVKSSATADASAALAALGLAGNDDDIPF